MSTPTHWTAVLLEGDLPLRRSVRQATRPTVIEAVEAVNIPGREHDVRVFPGRREAAK